LRHSREEAVEKHETMKHRLNLQILEGETLPEPSPVKIIRIIYGKVKFGFCKRLGIFRYCIGEIPKVLQGSHRWGSPARRADMYLERRNPTYMGQGATTHQA
jgi:hypothetical protein